MSTTSLRRSPPVVELVLGVQFSPLTKLTNGHYGLLWNELGTKEWISPSDWPAISDQFETFDGPKWSSISDLQLRLEPVRPPGRFRVENRKKDRVVQVQATRFLLNWRKREDVYPRYENLVEEFSVMFNRFKEFADRSALGPVAINQWELTYIDSFPQEEDWKSQADWSKLLPGLFGRLFETDGLNLALENRRAEWSYEISPRRGRLHVAAGPGRLDEDNRESLLLQMTARGPVDKDAADPLRSGFDLGHEVALQAFERVVDKDIQKSWEKKQS